MSSLACGGQRPVEAAATSAPVQTVQVYQPTAPPQPQQPIFVQQPQTTQAPVYTQPQPAYVPPQAPVQTTQAPQPQTVAYQISYGGNIPTAPTPAQYNEYTVLPPQAPVAPSQPVYQQQQYGAAPAAPQFVASTQPPVDFNCGSNQDGYYYKQQCTTNYYSCTGG